MVKLGTLIKEVTIKTTVNNQYEVLTSSQNGIVSQEEYFNKQVASQNNVGYKIIKKGQFTYRSMSDTGKFYINRLTNKDIGIVSPAYPVFEIVSNKIIPEYMELFFKTNLFQNQISNKSAGSTRLALRFSKLESVMIPVPDVSIQRNIVNNIKTIHSGLTCEQKHYSYYDELIKSRFNEMFLSEKARADLPIKKWNDVVVIYNGKDYKANISDKENGYPVYGSGGFMGVYANRYLCDGALTIIGRKGTINKPFFVDAKIWNIDTAFGIKTKKELIDPIYFFYRSKFYNYHELNKQTTKPSLRKSDLQKLDIEIPPMNLQKDFVLFVNQIDKLKFNVQKRIEYYQELLNKKMDEYFN